jgi:hypothetical protein
MPSQSYESGFEAGVDFFQIRLLVERPCEAGLIRHDDDPVARAREAGDGLEAADDRLPIVDGSHVCRRVVVDDAVAIEEDHAAGGKSEGRVHDNPVERSPIDLDETVDMIIQRLDLGNARRKLATELRLMHEAQECHSQGVDISWLEEEAAATRQQLAMSTEVRGDNGTPRHKGLLNSQRRILPPDRRGHNAIESGHQRSHVFWGPHTVETNSWMAHPLAKLGHVLGGVVEGAVYVERGGGRERAERLDQMMNALMGHEGPEIAEAKQPIRQ